MFAAPEVIGKCPAHPTAPRAFEFQAEGAFLHLEVAQHAEAFYCALLVMTPDGGKLSKPFWAAPAHTTPIKAFNERLRIAIDFVDEHAPEAVKFLRQWSPVVTLAE